MVKRDRRGKMNRRFRAYDLDVTEEVEVEVVGDDEEKGHLNAGIRQAICTNVTLIFK